MKGSKVETVEEGRVAHTALSTSWELDDLFEKLVAPLTHDGPHEPGKVSWRTEYTPETIAALEEVFSRKNALKHALTLLQCHVNTNTIRKE